MLQDKINAYLEFIQSEQLLEDYPAAEEHPRVISVIMKFDPPAEAGTAAERQALVQQWYRTRLTKTQPLLSQWPVPQARTYAGLPAGGYQDLQLVGEVCRLTYRVALSPTPAGVAYRLWAFNYTRAGFDASGTSELEDYLRVAPGPHPELDRMQHRLRVALAHW